MRYTYWLILLCVGVFALQLAGLFTLDFVLRPIDLLQRPWMIIGSMFAHSGIEHIAFNMLALFMFGTVLENRVGSNKFLFIYFISGVLGAVGFMLLSSPFDMALGASGAIFGVIGALVLLEPNLTVYFYLIPIPMYVAGPVYALIEIFALGSADSIAHSAHILGFFGGMALAFLERGPSWPPKPPMELWKALLIPVALSLVVAVAFGAYYNSSPLNQKIVGCESGSDLQAARGCFLGLAKDYKNNPPQQSYICDEYERIFSDTACRGV
jgi:membrane associated rhomboid family serine protease